MPFCHKLINKKPNLFKHCKETQQELTLQTHK